MSKIRKTIFWCICLLIGACYIADAQESWTTYTTMDGLPSNNCYSVAIDRSGNSWVGSRAAVGSYYISKYDGVSWTSFGFGDGVRGSGKVWALYFDSYNNLWAGTDGIGVLRTTDGGTTWDTTTFRMSNGMGSDSVRAIIEDPSGNIWFACGPHPDQGGPSGGLTKWNGSTLTTYKSDTSKAVFVGGGNSGLPDNFVQALTLDQSGNIWGGTKGNGAFRWDMSGAHTGWSHFTMANSNLLDNVVNPGAMDYANGFLWFGISAAPTLDKKGAEKFDGTTWTQVLSGARIWTIVHDWEDSVWMGDADPPGNATGLYKFAPDGSVMVKNWTTGDGMLDNIVRRIAVDDRGGKVWCVGQNGVSVLSGRLASGTSITYNMTSGWNLISLPVFAKDNQKSILFPTASSKAFAYDNGYTAVDSLNVGYGYWLKFEHAKQCEIAGALCEVESIDVKKGWNMIGAITESIVVTEISSDPPGVITSPFYEYKDGYIISNALSPTRGYWVKVSQAGKLILSSSAGETKTNLIRIVNDGERPPLPPSRDNNDVSQNRRTGYGLAQNYPNPFNPSTTVNYSLKEMSEVTIEIFNILGIRVATLFTGMKDGGSYTIRWDGQTDLRQKLASGVYFIRIHAIGKLSGEAISMVKKAVLSR